MTEERRGERQLVRLPFPALDSRVNLVETELTKTKFLCAVKDIGKKEFAMSGKACSTLKAVAVIIAGLLPAGIANAQGGADSLESQLAAKYKVAKIGQDSSGISVTDPGTVLLIKKGGILSVTSSNMVVIPSYVKDGQVHSANGNAMAGVSKLLKWKNVSDPTGSTTAETKFLTIGEKVYVSKIEVNRKDSKVSMAIIECDSCNSVQDASQRKAQVVFQFPKDYLAGADGGQVSDVISQVLEIQPEEAAQQDQPQDAQGQQQAQQPEAPAQPPPTIQLGQTMDEVKGLLGEPTKVVNLGVKQIYIYKDMKVVFLRGKVADVQ
jgi:hypothetical protein